VKFLTGFLVALREVLTGIATQMGPALVQTFKGMSQRLKASRDHRKLSHFDRTASTKGCSHIRHPAFQRPDPLIYSQQYLQKLGLAFSWDNPDIVLFRNGVVAPEGALLPNTEYEIDATVWNNSYEAPAVGVGVAFSFYSFGASTTLHPIGSTVANLGVKGGANHPAHARMKWRTPPAGHYCILVQLSWYDDLNPENNVGQNNCDVVNPASPAVSHFELNNDTGEPQRYRFEVDTYTIPPPPPCRNPGDPRPPNDQRWNEIQARHRPLDHPVPPGWTIAMHPIAPSLADGEQIDVTATITAPPGFRGKQAFNIKALYGNNRFAGGITVYVVVP
jgi:hypothetical protein